MLAETNFSAWIFDTHSDKLDKLALVDDRASLTYGQLKEHVRSFAGYLRSQQLLPQQRVIIRLDDSVAFPVAFLGCIYAGLNPVLVSVDMLEDGLKRIAQISDAVAIISDKNDDIGLKIIKEQQILQNHSQLEQHYPYHPDEMCYWLLSSGSSGQSKCIVHRHSNLWNLYKLNAGPFAINNNSKVLATPKMSWTYGLNHTITLTLGAGATSYMYKGISSPTKVFNRIDQNDITHVFTVPTLIASMMKHGKGRKINPTVNQFISAGESLPLSLYESFEKEFGYQVRDCIGMSEVVTNYTWHDPDTFEPGTIGTAIPGVECELRNSDGTKTGLGMIGEMYIKSPVQAMMYWKDKKSSCHTFVGEWVRTGDQMRQTDKGNFVYVARNDDLMKIQGLYVSPIEVESAIMMVQEVDECAVVAQSIDGKLPELYAFVVSGSNVSAELIKTTCARYLEKHKIPKHIIFVESLPKTLTNKKMRNTLRKDLLC